MKISAISSLALLFCAAATASAQIPEPLVKDYGHYIEVAMTLEWEPAARGDALLKRLRGSLTVEEARALMQDMAQYFYDLERGDSWYAHVVADMEREDMKAIGAEALPKEIELTRLTLKDGRVITGIGGLIARKNSKIRPDLLEGVWTCEPGFGVPGPCDFRFAPDMIEKNERVKVPLPKATVAKWVSERYEGNSLFLTGDWARPGKGVHDETVELQVSIVENGGALFENKDLGIRGFRWTAQCQGLELQGALKAEFRGTRGERRVRAQSDDDAWKELRAKAPDVEWPLPFVKTAEGSDALDQLTKDGKIPEDGDPAERLLRIRFALVYATEIPESALKDPKRFAKLEKAILAYLRGGPLDDALALAPTVAEAAAIVRRGLHPGPAPKAGKQGEFWASFPRDYHPWKRWPLLVVLHSSSETPEWPFVAWREWADEFGVILVCPQLFKDATVVRTAAANQAVMDVVKRACLEYNVDPNRVYLAGFGGGGVIAWRLGQEYSDRWAGVSTEGAGPKLLGGELPLLHNLASVPVLAVQGEFDGIQTLNARRAITELRALGAAPTYVEVHFLGHQKMPWRTAWTLNWLCGHRRPESPGHIGHFALSAYEGRSAWLCIREAEGHNWPCTEAQFWPNESTGVAATLDAGVLDLRVLSGAPKEVEIFHDSTSMGEEIQVRAGGEDVDWKPKPSAKFLLEEARASGERGRLYDDSIRVPLTAPK